MRRLSLASLLLFVLAALPSRLGAAGEPVLYWMSPSTGRAGSSVDIEIHGANLDGGAILTDPGIGATNVVRVNASKFTATIVSPLTATPGIYNIRIHKSVGISNPLPFTLLPPPPKISSIEPDQGMIGTSVQVTLRGSAFTPKSQIVPGPGIAVARQVFKDETQIDAVFNIMASEPQISWVYLRDEESITGAVAFRIVEARAPTLTSIAPNSGTPGASVDVVLTGTNFGSEVRINVVSGITVTNFKVPSPARITATFVISGTAPPGPRNVSLDSGAGSSNALPFTVMPATSPMLESITPSSGPAGTSADVVLLGRNLDPGTQLIVGPGITAYNVRVVDSTRMTARFAIQSEASPGPRNVYAETSAGRSNPVAFTVAEASAPALYSIVPDRAPAATSVSVTLNGANFSPGSRLDLGAGLSASSLTVVSATQITAVVTIAANAAIGPRGIAVYSAAGVSNTIPFTVLDPARPSLASITPNAVAAGAGVKATLSGSGFLPGTRLVVGAGLTASDTVVSSPLLITATLSATTGAEPGVRTIAVENDAGRSNAVSFTVMAANAPVLYSISPDRAAAGTSVNVLLTGYNFAAGMTVKTDPGVFASNQVFVSTTRLTATLTIPAGTAPGVRNLAVETAGGLSNAIPFTVTSVEIPELTSISPDAGAAGNTIGVTLRGRYFAAGAAIVTGPEIVVSDVRMADSTQLSATFFLAAGAAGGGYPVAVRTAAGTSNSVAFRIDPADAPPALLAVRPNSGTAGQTLNVVLSGTGFSSGAGIQHESGITLRDLRLVSSTGIAATLEIPARALPDSRSLWVLTAAGRSNSLPFTISAAGAPTLVSIDKESGTAGSSVEVVLTGEGFNSGDSVHVSNPGITVASVKATGPARIDAAFRIAATAAGMGNVRVVSAAGLASGAVLFRIRPASGLSISTPSQLPAGVVGQEYVQELAAMGGTAPYGDWRVAAGTLPPGINLALAAGGEAAALQGVPTAAGTYTFTVKVSDRALSEAAKEFTLTVGSGLAAISISAGGIVNGASNEAGPVAPGEVITILGSGLGPATAVYAERGDGGLLPVSLAGTRVLFDGIPAPLIRVHAYQVSAVAPYSLDGKPACQVSLIADGRKSNTVSLAVAATAPGIFTQDYTGKGPGLILNQDGSLNGIENPAPAGSTVRIFATGEGQTDPGGTDGKLADWPAPTPLAKVEVTIGGVEAKVLYAGGSPGLVAGQLHADVEVPPGLTPGAAVPVVMRVGGKNSQSGVVMTVGPAASGTAVAR